MTASLFDAIRWTDRYTAGDEVHDGLRTGVILAAHDCRGGMQKRCVTVEYPDGHRTTFGYDHTFLPLGGEVAPAVTPSTVGASSHTGIPHDVTRVAGGDGPGAVRPAPGPSSQTEDSTRQPFSAAPGA